MAAHHPERPDGRPGHDHDGGEVSRLSPMDARVRALETVLVERGLVDSEALDGILEYYEHEVGPHRGAHIVARAWTDPSFHRWLLTDASAAIGSLGWTGRQGEHIVAVECTQDVHHLVVCTLCSCYPWSILGLPPVWYKSPAYRAKAVRDPRSVLADVGVVLPDSVTIRVWDSTAEVRYLVIPRRPAGTEGRSIEELAALVTRDAMIGVGLVTAATGAATATPESAAGRVEG